MSRRPHLPRDAPKEFKLNLVEGNASAHVTAFLAQRKRYPVPLFEGTGIVMAAGGRNYLRMAFISISLMRQNGWDIPIEIWHMGPKELPHDLRRRFTHLDVRFVDAHQVRKEHPVRKLGGFELKSYAIAHSRFQHVMLLDADCVAIQNPSDLFNSPEYREYGVIVAPDIRQNRKANTIFTMLGVHMPEDFWEGESGFLMFDKGRHWRTLELIRWCNDYSDFFYRFVHGDKDFMHLCCMRTGTPFLMLPMCDWLPFGIRHYWFDRSVVADHHMDHKRNPGAEVPYEHRVLWRKFEEWDSVGSPLVPA